MDLKYRVALVVVAAAVAGVALVILQPGDAPTESTSQATNSSVQEPAATGTTEEQPSREPTRKRRSRPRPPLLTAEDPRTVEVTQGATVRFAARSSRDDEIHVHGYDVSKAAPAGKTVRMSIPATITGIFEIELEHAGTPIGELKVTP